MAVLTKVKGSVETTLKKLALLIGATLVGTSTGKTVQEVLDEMDTRMGGIEGTQAKTLGMYIGQTVWHPYRQVIPGGLIPLDGQQLDVTAGGVMVGLHDAAVAGLLPVTTEALWQSDPTKRNCYVIDVSGKIRLPDMNGATAGSYSQPGVVGDNGTIEGQMQKGGVPNLTGRLTANLNWGVVTNLGTATGVFEIDTATTTPNLLGGGQAADSGRALLFKANKASDVYQDGLTEVRTNRAVGCWCVVAFGGASDITGFDPSTLASRIEAVYARLVTLEGRDDYAKIETVTNPALNSRTVFSNPFGNSTPVFCYAEFFHATLNKWVKTTWVYATSTSIHGTEASYSEGEGIVLKIGLSSYCSALAGNSQEVSATYATPSPVRIHVFKAFGS